MKKLVVLLITMMFVIPVTIPVQARTKHKTVKKMSKRQIRNAQHGKNMYYRKHGKMVKR